MDIGCSSGLLLELLRRRLRNATLIGADYVRGPLESLASRMPGLPLLQFDLVSCPLPESCVDAVVALNVLEHIEDDLGALGHIRRILRPGGVAVIEVPAGPHLYDLYDKELLHFRRYSMFELLSKVRASNLEIVSRSHLGFFLYPGFALVKRQNQWRSRIEKRTQKEIVARNIQTLKDSLIMRGIMSIEQKLRPLVYYPLGIRCVIICRRPVKE
jgi:SAM-dependent methyltransferase